MLHMCIHMSIHMVSRLFASWTIVIVLFSSHANKQIYTVHQIEWNEEWATFGIEFMWDTHYTCPMFILYY